MIFANIRKFIVFLLSGNVGEIMAITAASLIGLPLPLLPLQILFLNLVLDVFPALALGVGHWYPRIMQTPPRAPSEPILTGQQWVSVFAYGTVIAASTLGALTAALLWLGREADQAVTVSFLALAFSRLWHVFNMRDNESPVINNEITRNKYVWAAVGLCIMLLLVAIYVPFLSTVLTIVVPGPIDWAVILGASAVPLVVGQIAKRINALQ